MRLALSRGETVEETKAAVPEREFRIIAAFFNREPSVEQRLDFWFSQVLALLGNVFRKKDAAAIHAKDLIPDWWGERKSEEKTPADWREWFKSLTKNMGGTVDGEKHRQPGNHHQRQRRSTHSRDRQGQVALDAVPEPGESDSH